MTARRPTIAAVLLVLVSTASFSHGQTEITAENLRDEHVRAAIRAIVEEIYARRSETHFWEPEPYPHDVARTQSGGYTALTVLSLLYAGETYQDERLRDAIEFLEETDLGGTYAVAVRANIWALLPPRFEPFLDKDRKWLIDGFSERVGGWNYEQEPNTGRRDNSITQYGALGLWESAKRGLRVEQRYWQILEDRFIDLQVDDGGWNYDGTGPSTGSMTTAGLTVLFITQDFLHAAESVRLGNGAPSPNQAAIDRGLAWMQEHFSAETNPGRDLDFYYYLYGVERVGFASGYKFFGGHDWYREGAAELIRRFCAWNPETRAMSVHQNIGGNDRAGVPQTVDLSFALMFLSRGRVPVAINKLSDPDTAWNNRPRDVANLTRRIQETSEAGLNWQIVDMSAEAEQWLDAPLLYFASHERPAWIPNGAAADEAAQASRDYRERVASGAGDDESPPAPTPQLAKVRRYLDLGGTLFVNSEGEGGALAQATIDAGRMLYPHLEWKDLPLNHEAYTLHRPVDGKPPALKGLSNGVRELIILSHDVDFSETYQAMGLRDEPTAEVGMNVFLLASEMNRSRPRLDQHVLERQEDRVAAVPITIVRASHGGEWDAEPLALDVFSAWAWNERGLDVTVLNRPLASIATLSPRPSLVVVSGVAEATLSAAEIEAIKAYVSAGGTILFETAGGRGAGGDGFATGAETALRGAFDQPARALMRHPVVTGEGVPGAASISRVEYRPYSFQVFGARETSPRLRGITFDDGRARVLFSREDISHGLLNQPMWGVCGYTPTWARNLLANIVQYAASR